MNEEKETPKINEDEKPPVIEPKPVTKKGGDPVLVFEKINNEVSACNLPNVGALVKVTDSKGNFAVTFVPDVTPKIDPRTKVFTLVRSLT